MAGAEAEGDLSDLLIRLIGWRGALHHGNTTVLDRWRHLKRRLPPTLAGSQRLLEVGCGTGGFTMGAASRGYDATGLSWDERNQAVAKRRASLAGVTDIDFPIGDARRLGEYRDLVEAFDVVVCFEVVEHILDDRKLFRDLYGCLKPGGRLLLTTPNFLYHTTAKDIGPFRQVEDGGHVRRGYSPAMLCELCAESGFEIEEITYVSFFFSQLVTRFQTWLGLFTSVHPEVLWLISLPLRPIPPLLDGWLGRWICRMLGWPGYSIALTAYKRRFPAAVAGSAATSGSVADAA